jgi:hypothetical protein
MDLQRLFPVPYISGTLPAGGVRRARLWSESWQRIPAARLLGEMPKHDVQVESMCTAEARPQVLTGKSGL